MGKNNLRKTLKLSTVIFLAGLFASYSQGMNIVLEGLLDLDEPKAPGDPYLIEARLTGRTTITAQTVYGNLSESWDPAWALVGFSDATGSYCKKADSGFVVPIPNTTNKYGFELQFYTPDGKLSKDMEAWVIPALNYQVNFIGEDAAFKNWTGLKRTYNGKFFSPNPDLTDGISPAWNICMHPYGAMERSSYPILQKQINFSIQDKIELYTNSTIRPGNFRLVKNVSVMTMGPRRSPLDAYAYENVAFTTNIKIVRICKIKNVTKSTFDIVMGRTDQEILQTSFQYTCTADNKPIYISGIAREGRADKTNPRKLLFNNLDGSEPADNRSPWLLALPYKDGDDSTISCADQTNTRLMKFNNDDIEVGKNSISNQTEKLNIKWAVCSNNNVVPGKYRARVEVAVYTKV